jgi:hypothetical protein
MATDLVLQNDCQAYLLLSCGAFSPSGLAQEAYHGHAADDRALADLMDPGDPGRASPR